MASDAACVLQEGQPRLEDVTDVNSAFHDMRLALPSTVTIKEDLHGQQMDPMRGTTGMPSMHMQDRNSQTPPTEARALSILWCPACAAPE